jgi:excisionase family DNA binding protein
MIETLKIEDWPEILTPKEAAKLARLHHDTVYNAIKSGSLKCGRTGRYRTGHIRITKAAFLKWLGMQPLMPKLPKVPKA